MTRRLVFDGGWFEPLNGHVEAAGQRAILRPRTAAVLEQLMLGADRVVPRAELMKAVWPDTIVTDDSLAQCLKEIRQSLGDAAGRIRTVPRVGYAFVGPVRDQGDDPAALVTAPPSLPASRRGLLLATGALVVAVAGAPVVFRLFGGRSPAADPLSIVVLPLRASEPSAAHIAAAVTDALTADLSLISGSFVIARATASSFGDSPPPPAALGRQLGVRYLLEGTLERSGDGIQGAVTLVDTGDSRIVWTTRLAAKSVDLDSMSMDVVGRLARELHMQLIEAEAERGRRLRPARPDAHDLTMQGWSAWNRHSRADNARARALLEEAVKLDPQSAMAWAGLANTHLSDIFLRSSPDPAESLRLAAEQAARAYAIDPHHTNAQGSLGTVYAMQGRLDEALELTLAQLRSNPNYAPAHMWTARILTELGRPREAIQHARAAIRLSPLDPRLAYFRTELARAHLHVGETREAIEVLEAAARQPGLGSAANAMLAAALVQDGRLDDARRIAQDQLARQPDYSLSVWRSVVPLGAASFQLREKALIAAAEQAGFVR